MSLDPTTEVAVTVGDLEMIKSALADAQGAQMAWDLLEQFRARQGQLRPSRLSQGLTDAHNRIQGYLAAAEPEDQGLL